MKNLFKLLAAYCMATMMFFTFCATAHADNTGVVGEENRFSFGIYEGDTQAIIDRNNRLWTWDHQHEPEIFMEDVVSDGMHQVGFSESRTTVNIQRIVSFT